jgi:hypothetical protein
LDLAGLNNSNFEELVPGATAAARKVLGSGVVAPTGTAACATPGDLLGGLGLVGLPGGMGACSSSSSSSNYLPGLGSSSVVAQPGGHGYLRGRLYLPEQFADAFKGGIECSWTQDVVTGAVQMVHKAKQPLGPDALVKALPNYQSALFAVSRMHQAMQQAKPMPYVTLEEAPAYGSYMARIGRMFSTLSGMASAQQQPVAYMHWLLFDQQQRLLQYHTGRSWGEMCTAADQVPAIAALSLALGPAAGVPGGQPAGPAAARAVAGPGQQVCYAYQRAGRCTQGAACPYAATHACVVCGRQGHGALDCGKLVGGRAQAAGARTGPGGPQ